MSTITTHEQVDAQSAQQEPAVAGIDAAKVEAFAGKVASDLGVGHNTLLAYLGDRLGLWRSLAAHPGSTSAELAQRCGYAERYVREWLAAQAAAGYVTYDPATQSFTLPVEHALVLAEAFPASTFVGIDYHEESVRRARVAANGSGVSDRVTFEVGEAQAYDGTYDLICMFDTLHDLGDPVGALAYAKAHLAEDGWFFAVEPNAGDRLEDNLHPLGLVWYASGHNLCVPNAMSQGGQALGNQAGPKQTLQAFADGGFPEARKVAESAFNMVITARS